MAQVLFDRLKSNLAQCINDGTIYFVKDSNGNFTQIALGDGSKSHVVGIGPKMDDTTKQELMSKLGLTISADMGTIQLGKLANHNGVSSQKVITYERTGLGTDTHEISTVGYVQQYMKTAKTMVYAGIFNAQTKEITDYNNAIISPSGEGNVTFDYLLNGNEGETLLTPGMSFIVGTAGNLEGYTGISVYGGETKVEVGDMIIIINVQQKEGDEGGSTYNEASILIIQNTNLKISDGAITTAKLADGAVTASKLSTDIQSLISNLSKTATFAGIATPTTNPGTPEGPVFYIANGKGTYTNFGGIDVTEDEVIILYYDTIWHKEATGIASQEKLTELEIKVGNEGYSKIFVSSDMKNIVWDGNHISQDDKFLSLIVPLYPNSMIKYSIKGGSFLSGKLFKSTPKVGNSDVDRNVNVFSGYTNNSNEMKYALLQFYNRSTDESPEIEVITSGTGTYKWQRALVFYQSKVRNIKIQTLGSSPTDGINVTIPSGIEILKPDGRVYQQTSDITISETGSYGYFIVILKDNTLSIIKDDNRIIDDNYSIIAIVSPSESMPVVGLDTYTFNDVLYEPYTANYTSSLQSEIQEINTRIDSITNDLSNPIILENSINGVIFPNNIEDNVRTAIKKIWISCQTAGNVEKVLEHCGDLYLSCIDNTPRGYSPQVTLSQSSTSDDSTFIWFLRDQTEPKTGVEIINLMLSSPVNSQWGLEGFRPYINIEIDWDAFGLNKKVNNTGVKIEVQKLYRIEPKLVFLSDVAKDIVNLSLKDKTIVSFGDSLTEMVDTTNALHYSDYIEYFSGANVINVGIGGTQLRQRANPTLSPSGSVSTAFAALDICNMVKASCDRDFSMQIAANNYIINNSNNNFTKQLNTLQNINWSTVDAVTIFAGTNDWYTGGDVSVDHLGQSKSNDINYTLGAINEIIRMLLTTYPHLKIYWFVPIIRYVGDFSQAFDPAFLSDNSKQSNNLTLKEFAEAILNEVKNNHIPVCDMYNTLGWNPYNMNLYFTGSDGTHPRTLAGVTFIAKKILSFINSNRTF